MNSKPEKILFLITLICIFILLFILVTLQPKTLNSKNPQSFSINNANEKISITGKINKTFQTKSTTTIYIKNINIPIIIFNKPNNKINIQQLNPQQNPGQEIRITGKINFYKNNPQILADKITLTQTS
jgi:DNA/RNA endonuclease YhcR with UshA esterase domain